MMSDDDKLAAQETASDETPPVDDAPRTPEEDAASAAIDPAGAPEPAGDGGAAKASDDEASSAEAAADDAEAVDEDGSAEGEEAVEDASGAGDEDVEEVEEEVEVEQEEEVPANPELRWYVLRVQTGRENSVKNSIERRVKLEDMPWYFGRIMVPTETVSEIRDGRKRVVNRRTYAGYIFVEMEMTDEAQHLVTETPGVAGFVGVDRRTRTKPAPMMQADVDKMLNQVEKTEEEPKVDIKFRIGETVKVKEGPFENFDGVIEEINPAKGLVKVLVTIFGRPTSVELEYWQVESA